MYVVQRIDNIEGNLISEPIICEAFKIHLDDCDTLEQDNHQLMNLILHVDNRFAIEDKFQQLIVMIHMLKVHLMMKDKHVLVNLNDEVHTSDNRS